MPRKGWPPDHHWKIDGAVASMSARRHTLRLYPLRCSRCGKRADYYTRGTADLRVVVPTPCPS